MFTKCCIVSIFGSLTFSVEEEDGNSKAPTNDKKHASEPYVKSVVETKKIQSSNDNCEVEGSLVILIYFLLFANKVILVVGLRYIKSKI